jgi:rare lipoprotein A
MMSNGPWRVFRTGLMAVLLCLVALGLCGCGSRYVPGPGATPSPGKKTPAGKGGTYKPYTVMGQTYYPLGSAEGYSETGVASWYGPDFHGKKTANGEWYDMYQMTAAHRILPMHTKVMVRNLDNGRVAQVRINDRGPFVNNRVIDLSYAAASALGVVGPGTARVSLETIPGERIQYTGPFFVQYGAFVVEANARNLRNRLAARGFPGTRVARGELHGTTYWRVQVGAFPSLADAESARQRLAKESPDCFVIAD